ncbi:MAG: T9SS type A sorting domain-containing protein, partial [Bacteroidales bacterium]|nr:T9SS type A sorting domain-containing protein [Bacteroidales bacterium]
YEWNGEMYTESGDYTYEHLDANGCTQVDTLHLTIFNPQHTAVTAESCGSYEWNGQSYTESGDYTYEHLDANGCTQVDTLHLTINQAVSSEFAVETADSCYSWNGHLYCESGDYTQTLTAASGCDSLVTLHLTITVGIDDHEIAGSMTVYPNPTTGVVNVQWTINGGQWPDGEIQVVDMYGRLLDMVETQSFTSLQPVQFDLSRYASGIYFVRSVVDGNVMAVRKVVKQ